MHDLKMCNSGFEDTEVLQKPFLSCPGDSEEPFSKQNV